MARAPLGIVVPIMPLRTTQGQDSGRETGDAGEGGNIQCGFQRGGHLVQGGVHLGCVVAGRGRDAQRREQGRTGASSLEQAMDIGAGDTAVLRYRPVVTWRSRRNMGRESPGPVVRPTCIS